MASTAKILRPPFKWAETRQVVEDQQYKRWDQNKIRAMKNGTYDWKNHEEERI